MEAQDNIEDLTDMAKVYEGGQLERESQEAPETDPTLVGDNFLVEESQDERQFRGEFETSHQTDPEGSSRPPSLNLPQSDTEPEPTQRGCHEEQIRLPVKLAYPAEGVRSAETSRANVRLFDPR